MGGANGVLVYCCPPLFYYYRFLVTASYTKNGTFPILDLSINASIVRMLTFLVNKVRVTILGYYLSRKLTVCLLYLAQVCHDYTTELQV